MATGTFPFTAVLRRHPDNAAASSLLPVKKAVRTAEDLVDGDPVEVIVELADERHTGAGGSSR